MIFKKLSFDKTKKQIEKIDKVQIEFGIKLPILYFKFITTYALGQYIERWEASLDRFLRPNSVIEVFFERDSIIVQYGWLFSPEELHHDLNYYGEKEFMLNSYEIIRIGNIISGGGLYLGIGNENKDFIFKMNWDQDSQPIKIADSIFDFINGLEVRLNQKGLTKKIGQLFYQDPRVSFDFNNTIQLEITSILKEDLPTISESIFLNQLNQLLSDVRDRNFGNSI